MVYDENAMSWSDDWLQAMLKRPLGAEFAISKKPFDMTTTIDAPW